MSIKKIKFVCEHCNSIISKSNNSCTHYLLNITNPTIIFITPNNNDYIFIGINDNYQVRLYDNYNNFRGVFILQMSFDKLNNIKINDLKTYIKKQLCLI